MHFDLAIFNLRRVYWDINPLQVREGLYWSFLQILYNRIYLSAWLFTTSLRPDLREHKKSHPASVTALSHGRCSRAGNQADVGAPGLNGHGFLAH